MIYNSYFEQLSIFLKIQKGKNSNSINNYLKYDQIKFKYIKKKTICVLNILFNQNIIISYSNNIYYLISFISILLILTGIQKYQKTYENVKMKILVMLYLEFHQTI